MFDLRILLESYAIMRSGNCLTLEKHHELNDCMERLKTYHSQDDIQRYEMCIRDSHQTSAKQRSQRPEYHHKRQHSKQNPPNYPHSPRRREPAL